MGYEAIPRDRIERRAQRIMQHQRERDARFTDVLTWTSLCVAALNGFVVLLLVANVVQPDTGSWLLALLGAAPGVVTTLLRVLRN